MQENARLKYLSVHLDDEGKNVVASFAPAEDVDSITYDDLKGSVDAAGFGEYRLNESALHDALVKYTAGEPFVLIVGEAVDGEFDISIDDNQLNAYLTCRLPCGGMPVTLEHVLKEAKRQGITQEIDHTAIETALKEGGENILIASGKAAVDGMDAKFESLIPGAKKRSPHLDENGMADFRELGGIPVVHAGDALMRRILPTSGESGLTLSGKTIPAKPGKDAMFATKLSGVEFDPADQNVLVAAIDGSPHLLENGASVEPIYKAQDVDLHIGNIDFLGTVNVTGEVQTGMTIKASGDIHISNTIEGVMLIAGGDIVVKGGIIGLTERGKTIHSSITCKGSCNANFVQNAHISAGNGIFIRDFVMQSELSARHQVIIGDKGGHKGYIIGGVTRARVLIKAQVIGSPARAKTVLIAGVDQTLYSRLAAIAEARNLAADKLLQIVKLLDLARANPDRIPAETAKAAEATRIAINAELSALLLDEKEVKREIATGEAAQVVAEKQFLEGTEIHFGSKHQSFLTNREGGIVQLKEDKLVFT